MKIFAVHDYYQQPGGEDRVFEAERDLLRSRGHEVVTLTEHNDDIPGMTRLTLAARTFWSRRTYRRARDLIRRERPDVVHVHNTLPLISPSVYHAAHSEGVPVVQTLHNYRLLCPMAQLFRAGSICEDCLGRRLAWPGIRHACYRGSRTATASVAVMTAAHRALGTWSRKVDLFIALTEFARSRFVAGGLEPSRVAVKPNFVDPDPGVGEGGGGYALFVGRLSPEKGVDVLLRAWERLGGEIPLEILGDGPLAGRVRDAASNLRGVEWRGRASRAGVLQRMKQADLLVFPSVWYEGFPVTIAEAFATGLPVVASDIGGLGELVRDRETGFLAPPGDAVGLAETVREARSAPDRLRSIRGSCRETFGSRYSGEVNHRHLIQLYQSVAR